MNYPNSLNKKRCSGMFFALLDFAKVWEGTSGNGLTAGILHLMNYSNSLNEKLCSGMFFALLDFSKDLEVS